MDGTTTVVVIATCVVGVVAVVALLLVAGGRSRDEWHAGATAFAATHPGLAIQQRRTGDVGPFATTYEVLAGTWHGWPVSVQRSAPPNRSEHAATHTRFECGPDPRWPADVVIGRKLVTFRGGEGRFDERFSASGGDRATVAAWLTPSRKAAIVRVADGDGDLALSARYGVTLHRKGTDTDPAWLADGLDTVTWLAQQLA